MTEILCIAMAIYFEARSEPLDGQVAVANTIVNRVHSPYFPDTPCEVVKQGRYWQGNIVRNQCHFSYWCDGRPEIVTDHKSYVVALSIAVNWENLVDITRGATHYHRDDVNPYWSNGYELREKIGRHVFYGD